MKAVVFDLDGTLIESYRDIAAALNHVLAQLGRQPHDPEVVKRMIGGGVASLLRQASRSEDVAEARALFKDAYFERLVETTRPYDGVVEMLDALAEGGVTVLIATNKPSFFTRPILEALELDYVFACADEVPHKKPSPEVVELVMKRAGATAAVAYVGDMPVDVETARRAGVPSIGVIWGFDPQGMLASGPDQIAERPGKLGELILGM